MNFILQGFLRVSVGYLTYKAVRAFFETLFYEWRDAKNPGKWYFIYACDHCKTMYKETSHFEMDHCLKCGTVDLRYHKTPKKLYDMLTRQSYK